MERGDFSIQGGSSSFDRLLSYRSMSFKQKTESFRLDAKDSFLLSRLLSLGSQEEGSISSLDLLMQEETESPLAKIEAILSAAPPCVQSLNFCSLRRPTSSTNLAQAKEVQQTSLCLIK